MGPSGPAGVGGTGGDGAFADPTPGEPVLFPETYTIPFDLQGGDTGPTGPDGPVTPTFTG